jgi:hypothetical protein
MLNTKPYEQYIMAQQGSVWRVKINPEEVIKAGKEAEEWSKEPALASYEFVERNLSWQLGQVLTIIDASISDKKQNKAIKDLIKNSFHDRIHFVYKKLSGEEIYNDLQQSCNDELIDNLVEMQDEEITKD